MKQLNNNNRLSVLLTSRDRPILTQKCIESINKTSSLFKEINIYVFDNLSNPNEERLGLFSKLLKEEKIKYYSYDTSASLCDCFGKAIAYNRWIGMMKMEHDIRKISNSNSLKDYYILIDNDMILGPEWDKFFITANDELLSKEPDTHYLVKFPCGLTNTYLKRPTTNKYRFTTPDNIEFDVISTCWGGGSGFWFMNYEQLCKTEWESKYFANTYKQFKRHDITSWFRIKDKYKRFINFVSGIKSPDDKPLVLHIGEVLKCSMCNVLTKKGPSEYKRVKSEFLLKELDLVNMSAKEIYNKFKSLKAATIW